MAKLEREAQERQTKNQLQAEVIKKETAKKKAEALRQAEARQRKQQEQVAARLAKFRPLLDGKTEPASLEYYWAREAVQQVADAGGIVHSSDARDILKLSDEITQFRLEGRESAVKANQTQIIDRLSGLLDA